MNLISKGLAEKKLNKGQNLISCDLINGGISEGSIPTPPAANYFLTSDSEFFLTSDGEFLVIS